ncbi:chloride channel protein [Natroniella sulfidigena]|uniref:chloride channel protein n=1 Tax=Natroniella sulfidigena TaxID=723921 RepID=UPI00200A5BB3|nr:chloride channel protein [Natroniella sulfidigena]MCK8817955.1 chloride channel protein [Natroniella sulfidigena]
MFTLKTRKFFEDTSLSIKYILKWSVLAVMIGVIVGMASVIFKSSLNLGTRLLASLTETHLVYILPIIGLFMSGLITSTFASEAAGPGADAIIKAYNENWGKADIIVVPIRLISSVFTIVFGGSAGMEDPAVHMGGGIASFVGDKLNLKLTDIQKITICGMSAAFGSIFTVPLAGGVFGPEIIYRDDLDYDNLFISFISSITAYFVYAIMLGQTRIFNFPVPLEYTFVPTRDILLFIVVGVIVGLTSLLFIKILHGYEHFSEGLSLPPYFKTALGGVLVGVTALIISPYILGSGLSLLELITIEGKFTTQMLFLMIIGKIVATSFTLGSGASGGVVVPSLVVGGLTGAFLAQVFNFPYPIALISAGSVGVLGSAAHIPISMTLMAAEVFGMELIKPATIVCFIGTWIARNDTIYQESYVSRIESLKAPHCYDNFEDK